MRSFKNGAQIALQRDDLMALLTDALNEKLFSLYMDKHKITEMTLHPKNKYVIRLTVQDEA